MKQRLIRLDRNAVCGGYGSVGTREQCVRSGPATPAIRSFFFGGGVDGAAKCNMQGECGMSAEIAVKPIQLLLVVVRIMGRRNCILDRRTHRRHLANTVELLCAVWVCHEGRRRGLFPDCNGICCYQSMSGLYFV